MKMTQDAASKITVVVPEDKALQYAKRFFGWRKASIDRIYSLGTSQYDKLVGYIHKQENA